MKHVAEHDGFVPSSRWCCLAEALDRAALFLSQRLRNRTTLLAEPAVNRLSDDERRVCEQAVRIVVRSRRVKQVEPAEDLFHA